jgi:hypothetical protein
MKCDNCCSSISLKAVIGWVNSGIEAFECRECHRLISGPLYLLGIYFCYGLLFVFGLSYIEEVHITIGQAGFVVSQLATFFLLSMSSILGVYITGFAVVKINA